MGYLPGTLTPLPAGNGNGFKSGGYGADPTKFPANPPRHVIRNDVAFVTKAAGFYANHHPVSSLFYNNTSFDNGVDFDMLGMSPSGAAITVGVYRNDLAFSHAGKMLLSNNTNTVADDADNSWTLPITLTDTEFQSVSDVGMDGPRGADGSLPCVGFLRPQAASDFIGKGKDIGLPFSGPAPDLGAFQHGACGASSGAYDAGLTAGGDASSSGVGSSGSTSGVGSSGSASGVSASGSASGAGSATSGSGANGDASAGPNPDGGSSEAGATRTDAKSGCGCDAVGSGSRSGFDGLAAAGLLAAVPAWRRRRRAAGRSR